MQYRKYLFAAGVMILAASVAMPQEGSPVAPGRYDTPLVARKGDTVGSVGVWNTANELRVAVEPSDGWKVSRAYVFVGEDDVPVSKEGVPKFTKFPYVSKFKPAADDYQLTLDLVDDLEFAWGRPWYDQRAQNVAVYVRLVKRVLVSKTPTPTFKKKQAHAWAFGPNEFDWSRPAWWSTFELEHPRTGQFIDAPVKGLSYDTPTHDGETGDAGGFPFFPGETLSLAIGDVPIGSAKADRVVTPLDVFEATSASDSRVVNMARLLQTLDGDGGKSRALIIDDDSRTALGVGMAAVGIDTIDFSDDDEMDALIEAINAADEDLPVVSAEDALEHLEDSLENTMFRKNVSKTPELPSAKAKLNVMPVRMPAQTAGGDAIAVEYFDDAGEILYTREDVAPLVITYADADPDTGAHDAWIAISRDDGNSWKRINLSRSADKSSFTTQEGTEVFGHCKKPILHVKGNCILVAWVSQYARGGSPRYAIDTEDDYTYDDPFYADDIWGIAGRQRSHDYAEDGFEDVGEVPYFATWVARVMLDPVTGEITTFKPERLTSGVRDANQIFVGGASGVGFSIVWQEDPNGVRPGKAVGPGEGWSGATVSHKTDVWYTHIRWADFKKIDTNFEPGGDPEHEDDEDFAGRPKWLVPMALPVRLSDNDVINSDNLQVELDSDGYPVTDADGSYIPLTDDDGKLLGTHRYGYEIDGLLDSWVEFENEQGETKVVAVTEDERILDGDTGAARANVFLQPYTKPDGTKSAWTIIGYSETKGVGSGAPDHEDQGSTGSSDGGDSHGDDYVIDEGKIVIYHSFDFANPDLVSGGNVMSPPLMDEDGNIVYAEDEDGTVIVDPLDRPIPAYENARRIRFLTQPKGAMGGEKVVAIALWKQGEDGMGGPSDIMLRRCVADASGNPYAFARWKPEIQNVSAVTPTETWVNPDSNEDAKGDGTIVVTWSQDASNVYDASWENPYEDARAHRGQLRGDKLIIGYSYTPNWAAARNGNDVYDFYVRRSFDGGKTWTNDPDGTGTTFTETFKDPVTKDPEVVTFSYLPGAFERARNVSQLPNNKATVIEPRIVATPGPIKDPDTGKPAYPEDARNIDVVYLSYGTATNPKSTNSSSDEDEEVEIPAPLDLFYSYTANWGEDYTLFPLEINSESSGNNAGEIVWSWNWLAKTDAEEGECQLRMTPDGSRLYATWLQESDEESDVYMRRILWEE